MTEHGARKAAPAQQQLLCASGGGVDGAASSVRAQSGSAAACAAATAAARGASPAPAAAKTDSSWSYISRSLLAGGLAGCMAKTAVAPLDRVKILFQGANSSVSQWSGSIFGGFRAVHWIGQQQGIRGIYKGHQATLLRIFPYAALNYMCYEQYKRLIRKQQFYPIHCASATDLPPIVRLLAGSAAGLTSVFFTYPLDYVHSRITYQVKITRYKGVLDTIRLTVQEAGIKGLYRGFGATALGIIPYAGMSFFTYDTLKNFAADHYQKKQQLLHAASSADPSSPSPTAPVPVVVRLLCGALAGSAAQTASYPLDVVRRRMQLYGLSTQLPKYRNTLHALVSIIKNEGVKKLYVGLSINYIKVGPAHAISFVTYEYLKDKLNIK